VGRLGRHTGSPAQFAGAIKNNVGGAQGRRRASRRPPAWLSHRGRRRSHHAQRPRCHALVDVYKFLLSMIQMNAPKAGPAASQLQSFIGSMNVTTSGNVVKFTAQLPEAELEKLINGGRHTTAQLR
jgi:hypothetical protein